MFPGFLPFSRASFMLDFVVLAMLLIVPILLYSIYLVKQKKEYEKHKRLQLAIGVVLGIAVLAFELDMRIFGWRQYAEPSPYMDTILLPFLWFHIAIATATTILWIVTIIQALKNFPTPVVPTIYSNKHKRLAKPAALGLLLTSITGWIFFYMAFVA